MLKRILIISPYFPPSNAPDMQRVRMSLPYFKEFGWDAEVVYVSNNHSDINKDPLLIHSVPKDTMVHEVEAFNKNITSKIGLGSIAIRSLWFYKKKVDHLLTQKKYDLIYFSTTQFPVCILGPHWKRKFHVPYIIDMQDPWHSDYYNDKPKSERPPKYWFAYYLNKFMEPIALKSVDGLISVSAAYIETIKQRYPQTKHVPSSVITFGAFEKDFEIANEHQNEFKPVFMQSPLEYSILYIGRGGNDMRLSVMTFFEAFKEGLNTFPEIFKKFKIYFIGTSYASKGQGKLSIQPLANEMGLKEYVLEQTDRISFYRTLITLQSADVLFIPGSDDPQYTASKIYPYLMAKKPLISIFHKESSAGQIINECRAGLSLTFDMDKKVKDNKIIEYLTSVATHSFDSEGQLHVEFEKYTAKNMTKLQVDLFETVIKKSVYLSN